MSDNGGMRPDRLTDLQSQPHLITVTGIPSSTGATPPGLAIHTPLRIGSFMTQVNTGDTVRIH